MLSQIQKIISNLPGWRTKRKIIVIESDDWGSVRMPSLRVYHELKDLGLDVSSGTNEWFNTLDTIESSKDLECLFDTLKKFKDFKGRHPIITAMSLCANPDFEKIEQYKFTKYFFEPLITTFERYGMRGAFAMYKQGASDNLFYPEFHGREHLNVKVWMDDLQQSNKYALGAFKRGFWGFRNENTSSISYQAAFDLDQMSTLSLQREIIESGLELFEKLHDRKASAFVPPNGAIHKDIICYAVTQGIKYVSSPKIHNEPQGSGKVKRRFRYLGMKGGGEMIYLTRNCFFEPSYAGKGYSVNDCMQHIQIAFMLRKPAIISTHRVNYIGGLSERNRVEGNNALSKLLTSIILKWPDVEFMTTVQLGDLIKNDKK